jgi:4-aminobutyrate aminotransferase-like enzyme
LSFSRTASQTELEELRTTVPGPRTRELARGLQTFESRNVTFVDTRFPVFWHQASGATVTDVDGNRYIDLTAAFGVANTGHCNSRVAAAIGEQAAALMHAMGDVHPTQVKVQLLETLARITPGNLSKTFLCSTGAEAVEAALKTAMLATGKTAFAAYHGAYHGLSFGTLEISGIERFRKPFAGALSDRTLFLDYPRDAGALEQAEAALLQRDDIAAVVIEPIQARGGCLIAPEGYLAGLREICTTRGIILIFDEIYTGFGRTGALFACQHEGVVPDILCVGKAIANGFPISAAIAAAHVMDAWPISAGEALHTSTYLGNPMGCAAARANLAEIERLQLCERAAAVGDWLGKRLRELQTMGKARDVRGRGLMWGVELRDARTAQRVVIDALKRGVILLQSGVEGNVLSITPPLVISEAQLARAMQIVTECM